MAAWPGTLPASFIHDSLQFQLQRRADFHKTDVGPTITRQRFTASSEFFTGQMHMSSAQYDILVSFYNVTLFGGSQKFDWTHPLTGVAKEFRFDLSVERHRDVAGLIRPGRFIIDLAFEILP